MKSKVKNLDKVYEELSEYLKEDDLEIWEEETTEDLPRQPYRSSSSGEWGLKGSRLC